MRDRGNKRRPSARRGRPRRLLGVFAATLAVLGLTAFVVARRSLAWGAGREEDPNPLGESGVLRDMSVTVNGCPIYTRVGDKVVTTPPVVLVHGLALSGRYMVPTAELLARTYRVYVPDLPGFGDSGKPAQVLDVAALSDALAAWMQAAGIERAMLLGNSFGCQIIADFAARYPERVARAVLQGPTTPPGERSWFWQFIRWRQNSPYNPPEMNVIASRDYRKTGLMRALRTFQISIEDRPEDKLPRVEAPTLVVRGALDPICHQDWAEKVTHLLTRGQLAIIPEVAHTLVFTSAPELVAAVRPFLDQGTAERGSAG